jgi:hypothetical protein
MVLATGVPVILVLLTFLPALSLGPLAEGLHRLLDDKDSAGRGLSRRL